MNPEESNPSLSDLPEAQWSSEDVVDYDILADLIRDAIGVLSKNKHEERSKETPDQRAIERISERQEKLSKSLRDLRVADAKTADQLRIECLAIIKSGKL
ncbi:hypothetical protein [Nocardiopsis halotolerans]|uniref:hypothetical protein n=1 Tax=Nocardiopsis halotolerans TaxID=124252 RepID=UPI00036C1750|nr:hypothetical protein [Nocardiopsis halotolerans]